MEAALKASIALPQLPTPKTLGAVGPRRRAALESYPNGGGGLTPHVSVCAGLFRVLNVPAVPEGDHTEGPGWAGLPRRHGHRQRQVHLVESVSLACFFFWVFYYDEMAVRRLFLYLFILGGVLSMVQSKFQCCIYWTMSCTSGAFWIYFLWMVEILLEID